MRALKSVITLGSLSLPALMPAACRCTKICHHISLETDVANQMAVSEPVLLAIIELGGYPDFTRLYRESGYEVVTTDSVRRAVKLIRRHRPAVIVAEFNFQSDFRDRTSSLETVFSSLQGVADASVIVFYEKEYAHQFEKLLNRFEVFQALEFPIDKGRLQQALRAAHPGGR